MKTKKLLHSLSGNKTSHPPIWFMRQAGRYLPEYLKLRQNSSSFLEFCYNPDLAVEATLQPIQRYAFDAAILFSDILVIPDALGQYVTFKEGEGPVLTPIRSSDDLSLLSLSKISDHLEPVMETIRGVVSEVPENIAVIGFCGGPWTVAVYMVEGRSKTNHEIVRSWSVKDPEGFSQLINLITDASIEYLLQQIKNGVEVVQIFDSWAGVLDKDGFYKWVIEPTKRIVEAIWSVYPKFPIIGFPRLAGNLILDYVVETKVCAVGLDQTVSLSWAANKLQRKCALQGNLDNMVLVEGGNQLKKSINNILEKLNDGPFIFNLGHGVLPSTPPVHVSDAIEIIKSWRG